MYYHAACSSNITESYSKVMIYSPIQFFMRGLKKMIFYNFSQGSGSLEKCSNSSSFWNILNLPSILRVSCLETGLMVYRTLDIQQLLGPHAGFQPAATGTLDPREREIDWKSKFTLLETVQVLERIMTVLPSWITKENVSDTMIHGPSFCHFCFSPSFVVVFLCTHPVLFCFPFIFVPSPPPFLPPFFFF